MLGALAALPIHSNHSDSTSGMPDDKELLLDHCQTVSLTNERMAKANLVVPRLLFHILGKHKI